MKILALTGLVAIVQLSQAVTLSEEICSLPSETGPCKADVPRWYHDSKTGKCLKFKYGGCEGNKNNFKTKEDCENKCQTAEDICSLPAVTGPCRAEFSRWHYDRTTGKCSQFIYGGCDGNKNNFKTKEDCENKCDSQKTAEYPCFRHLQKALTPTTDGDKRVASCDHQGFFVHKQCDETKSECWCVNRLGKEILHSRKHSSENISCDVCSIPKVVGPCKGAIQRWFYNKVSGKCEGLVYGGCQGNGNNFRSQAKCQAMCLPHKLRVEQAPSQCQSEALQATEKPLPPGRFTPQCNPDGSYHLMQCQASTGFCWCAHPDGTKYPGSDVRGKPDCEKFMHIPDVVSQVTTSAPEDVCILPVDSGNCMAYFPRWYYNAKLGKCMEFVYGGCQGNGNNFETKEKCEQRCSPQSTEIVAENRCKNVTCSSPYSECRLISDKAQCQCPLACPLILYPVCGTDGNTYDNECVMKAQACKQNKMITVTKRGECEDKCLAKKCSKPFAKCRVVENNAECYCPQAVILIYHPVCGSDGKTYPNEEAMKAEACYTNQRITVAGMGECEADLCKGVQCARPFSECHVIQGHARCLCQEICTREYAPVCGSDSKTYGNLCMMRSSACRQNKSIAVVARGECESQCKGIDCSSRPYSKCEVVSGTPQCQCQLACDRMYAPVCGSDGKTYGNLCMLEAHACETNKMITVANNGECKENLCETVQCSRPYAKCHIVNGSPQCQCQLTCNRIYAPVCGSDGKTYGNLCMLKTHACENNKTITVTKNGECEKAKSKVVEFKESQGSAVSQEEKSGFSHKVPSGSGGSVVAATVLSVLAVMFIVAVIGVLLWKRRQLIVPHKRLEEHVLPTIREHQ